MIANKGQEVKKTLFPENHLTSYVLDHDRRGQDGHVRSGGGGGTRSQRAARARPRSAGTSVPGRLTIELGVVLDGKEEDVAAELVVVALDGGGGVVGRCSSMVRWRRKYWKEVGRR